jgi:hypothetical protein
MTTTRRSRPYLLGLAGLLLGGLLVAEGAGVTRLLEGARDSARGECTLAVEVSDSEARVRIAGQGRVWQGTGSQEVRLPPGHYEVRILEAGRVWQEKEVDLGRHERVVLACKMAAPRSDWVAGRPFVLLARGGRQEVGFDTLREAVDEADPGDAIEVRGNGPFVGPPLTLDKPLAIRAAPGSRPVLKMSPGVAGTCLRSTAPLVLEGLDLDGWKPAEEKKHRDLVSSGQALLLANCRFRVRGRATG